MSVDNFSLTPLSCGPSVFGRNLFIRRESISDGPFSHWTIGVWGITLLTAFSGITTSFVIKYADNIKKTYCQTVGISGTAVISVITHDTNLTFGLVIGVIIVILSTIMYAENASQTEGTNNDKKRTLTENLSLDAIKTVRK
ncbi:hypothetical protein AB6A40_004179 [Gnathostoma spinigerum]|uniref:Uncharacterized protein n=1 Tax=Gnathostoma spinigerum TaxID=75299 RepID=A0ABD6ECV1_9BILA